MKKLVVAMLIAGTATVAADDKKAPDQPKPTPAKELETMKDFTKAWNCTGKSQAGEALTSKLTLKKELDGFWLSIKLETAKTKTMPAFTGMGMIGIDPVSKGWVFTGYDNMGGWINLKGKEASNTAVTWEGDGAMPAKVPVKMWMKLDAKKLNFKGEFGGKPAFDYDCK